MTFTADEEAMLKLMVAEREASEILNKENLVMGTAIRAEFAKIDKRIRDEHKASTTQLQTNLTNIKNSITERF